MKNGLPLGALRTSQPSGRKPDSRVASGLGVCWGDSSVAAGGWDGVGLCDKPALLCAAAAADGAAAAADGAAADDGAGAASEVLCTNKKTPVRF